MAGLQVCLGEDALQYVFSFLEPRNVARIAHTCHTFKTNADSEALWCAFEAVQRASVHASFADDCWAQAGDGSSAKTRWQSNEQAVAAHANVEEDKQRTVEEAAERAERLRQWKGRKTACIDELGVLVGSGTAAVVFTPADGTLELPVTKHVVLTLLFSFVCASTAARLPPMLTLPR